MKKEMYVSIPEPCHENWNAMVPQDNGRFCASCAKTVIDFSQMSDTQVLNYLTRSGGSLCGRFAIGQVARPLVPVKQQKKKIWWMAALLPLTALLNKAEAQQTVKKLTKTTYSKCAATMGAVAVSSNLLKDSLPATLNKVIAGTVVDDGNIPIAGASVIVKGTTTGTVTDSLGNFQMHFLSGNSSATFIITALGFNENEFTCLLSHDGEINAGLQQLIASKVYLGEVVVTGGLTIHHQVKKTDTIKTTVRKVLRIHPVSIYPNPANRGTAIHVAIKKQGHYSIQLLDANSKLITNLLFDAEKENATALLTIPPGFTAGLYFIRLIDKNTKQEFIDKLVVI